MKNRRKLQIAALIMAAVTAAAAMPASSQETNGAVSSESAAAAEEGPAEALLPESAAAAEGEEGPAEALLPESAAVQTEDGSGQIEADGGENQATRIEADGGENRSAQIEADGGEEQSALIEEKDDALPDDADEGGEKAAGELAVMEEEEASLSSSELTGDQALQAFLDRQIPRRMSARRRVSARLRREGLTDNEKLAYDSMLPMAEAVAAGTRTDTKFRMQFSASADTGGFQCAESYTAEDLGTAVYEKGTYASAEEEAAAKKAMEKAVGTRLKEDYSYKNVYLALRSDHPDLFFWTGLKYVHSFGFSYRVWKKEDGTAAVSVTKVTSTIYIQAGSAYCAMTTTEETDENGSPVSVTAAQDYVTDSAKILAVQTSISNAKAYVQNAAGMSDYGKLKYYLQTVDALTRYNYQAAADNESGSSIADLNPWQLIWVFDGDPDTNVVCEGYAKAFKYLCDLTSFSDGTIAAYVASGTIASPSNGAFGSHMWNLVTIGQGTYLVDPTWCDDDLHGGNTERMFLVGTGNRSPASGSGFSISWGAFTENGQTYAAGSASYRYDDDTIRMFSESERKISRQNYLHVSYQWSEDLKSCSTCWEAGDGTGIWPAEEPERETETVTPSAVRTQYENGGSALVRSAVFEDPYSRQTAVTYTPAGQ